MEGVRRKPESLLMQTAVLLALLHAAAGATATPVIRPTPPGSLQLEISWPETAYVGIAVWATLTMRNVGPETVWTDLQVHSGPAQVPDHGARVLLCDSSGKDVVARRFVSYSLAPSKHLYAFAPHESLVHYDNISGTYGRPAVGSLRQLEEGTYVLQGEWSFRARAHGVVSDVRARSESRHVVVIHPAATDTEAHRLLEQALRIIDANSGGGQHDIRVTARNLLMSILSLRGSSPYGEGAAAVLSKELLYDLSFGFSSDTVGVVRKVAGLVALYPDGLRVQQLSAGIWEFCRGREPLQRQVLQVWSKLPAGTRLARYAAAFAEESH